MQKITQTEIIEKVTKNDDLTAVEIIINHKNQLECSIILNDTMFSIPYETNFTFDLPSKIKEAVSSEVLVIGFIDTELPEAWRQSYLEGGISEDRYDRRVEFHAYNDMNEMFCIDRNILWDITGKWAEIYQDENYEVCGWKKGIIRWYKNHLI